MALVVYEQFGISEPRTLNGRAASVYGAPPPATGGVWSSLGSTGDWGIGDYYIRACTRQTVNDTGPRFGLLGPVVGACKVNQQLFYNQTAFASGYIDTGSLIRWVDANNHAAVVVRSMGGGTRTYRLVIYQVVGGVTTELASSSFAYTPANGRFRILVLTVGAQGTVTASLHTNTGGTLVFTDGPGNWPIGVQVTSTVGTSSALAYNGVLGEGRFGLVDFNASSFNDDRLLGWMSVETLAGGQTQMIV